VVYHTGMTCEEYQQLEQEEKEKKQMAENLGDLPFKKCPKCLTIIEKIAGCNAVLCTQCNISFCWRCFFSDGRDSKLHFLENCFFVLSN
jgi:hypothetical protein